LVRPGDPREEAYRARAQVWLERGHPEVALSLLAAGVQGVPDLGGEHRTDRLRSPGLMGQLDVFVAGRPGSAGLPALTSTELEALRQESDPAEALKIIQAASQRLQIHGAEARKLLRRYLERQKDD